MTVSANKLLELIGRISEESTKCNDKTKLMVMDRDNVGCPPENESRELRGSIVIQLLGQYDSNGSCKGEIKRCS